MAKKIFSSQEDIQEFISNACAQLSKIKKTLSKKNFSAGREREITFKFAIDDSKDGRKAILKFAPKAWIKMRALVDTFTGEVQWHGLVERESANVFLVKDVLIFPHEATNTTVMSDQEEYEAWLNSLDDDVFDACRLHGHSHVNMCVSPSSTDMEYRRNVLDKAGLPDEQTDLFYIFLITNKREEMSAEIYDLQNNALYSTDEIAFAVVVDENESLADFLDTANNCVKETHFGGNLYTYKPKKPEYTCNSIGKAGGQLSMDDDYDDYEDEDDWFRRIYGGRK